MTLNADQCLALTTMSRLDVELKISYCRLVDDAAGAFVKCLHSDRGPIKLHNCKIDTQIIVSALIGNSRVTKLKLYYARSTNEADMAVLVAAIANNRGLEELDFEDGSISDDNWSILSESLKAHPTLTILNLFDNRPIILDDIEDDDGLLSDEAQKAHRTRLLADMVQANTIMLTIELARYERDDHIYTDEILPYLETNRYRPRVLAIKKTIERPFREKRYSVGLCSVRKATRTLFGCFCRRMWTLLFVPGQKRWWRRRIIVKWRYQCRRPRRWWRW
jgi:hypothetical protein